jgi:biopolymer transport protein ExbD
MTDQLTTFVGLLLLVATGLGPAGCGSDVERPPETGTSLPASTAPPPPATPVEPAPEAEPIPLLVDVDPQGQLRVDGLASSLDALRASLASRPPDAVQVSAPASAPTEVVASVLAAVRDAGVEHVSVRVGSGGTPDDRAEARCRDLARAAGYAVDEFELRNIQVEERRTILYFHNPSERSSEDHFGCRVEGDQMHLLHEG